MTKSMLIRGRFDEIHVDSASKRRGFLSRDGCASLRPGLCGSAGAGCRLAGWPLLVITVGAEPGMQQLSSP